MPYLVLVSGAIPSVMQDLILAPVLSQVTLLVGLGEHIGCQKSNPCQLACKTSCTISLTLLAILVFKHPLMIHAWDPKSQRKNKSFISISTSACHWLFFPCPSCILIHLEPEWQLLVHFWFSGLVWGSPPGTSERPYMWCGAESQLSHAEPVHQPL